MKLKLFRYPLLFLALCLLGGAAHSEIVGSQREVLQDGIVHYTFDLELGTGPFEAIRLHRVVRERRPHHPVATVDGIFMITGATNTFEMIYLQPRISDVPPWDQSVAVFLAKNDIDVWGMDYGWALVPEDTSDFGFMEGWDLQREIDSVKEGLAAARSLRVSSGQGNRRLHLFGFSYGVPIGYALANEETQLPPGQRHVKGLVVVDSDLKFEDEARRQAACANAASLKADIAGGTFVDATGVFLKAVGDLAKFLPGAPSPIAPLPPFNFPPNLLTNLQFALFLGGVHAPWHFVGAEFVPFPIPTGLRFTEDELWVDLTRAAPPYMPLAGRLDIAKIRCEEDNVPFVDHLDEIALPILAIGAAGGAAPHHHSSGLTASGDVESFTVQLLSNDDRAFDFGHADLFTATDAEAYAWQPLLDWLLAHRANRVYPQLGSAAQGADLGGSTPEAPVRSPGQAAPIAVAPEPSHVGEWKTRSSPARGVERQDRF